MPRRKPVNPQPKLKQEEDKDDTKTGCRGDKEDEDAGPPQKKALLETPGEEEDKCEPTCDVKPDAAMVESEDQKSPKIELSQDCVSEVTIKPDTAKLKSEDKVKVVESTSAAGQSSNVVKCNQSLQALFEAAHSELENISKQSDGEVESVVSQPPVVQVAMSKVTDLTSALKSGQIVIIQCDSLERDKKASPQIIQQLVIDNKGAGKFQLPASMSNVKVVTAEKTPDHVYGVAATSGDGFSYQVNETIKPAFMVPRLATEAVVTVTVPPATSVGRKRKHPQKPGKHICPYCSRGCAKPSVLQKHIRAHTGERPYPCTSCGFAFKTKSNLYKHCKSRAHAIKIGLLTAPTDAANNGGASNEVKVVSDGSEEEMTPESPAVEEKMEAFVPKAAQGSEQKSSDGDNHVAVQPECTVAEAVVSGKTEGATDCQYYDVTFMTAEGTIQTVSLPAQLAMPVLQKPQPTTTATVAPSQVIIIRNPNEKPPDAQIGGVTTSTVSKNIIINPLDCNRIPSVVKTNVTPTLLPRQMSCGGRVQMTPVVLPPGGQVAAASTQPMTRAGLTPEMLHERITQLISSNAAIVDTPMADAPRPKRVSRHNSMFEPMLSTSQVAMVMTPVPPASTPVLFVDPVWKTTKPTPAKTDGGHFLGQVEPTDQPPGGVEVNPPPCTTSSGSGPGLTFTTSPSTNEIKIEIRLPKPAVTVAAVCSPGVVLSPSVTGVGQGGVACTPGAMACTPGGVASTPGGVVNAPVTSVERSVIKDLLLKGRSQSLPSNAETITPVTGEVSCIEIMPSMKCTTCQQTFRDAVSLDEHVKQSCPAGRATKPGQVFVVMAPDPRNLLCPNSNAAATTSSPVAAASCVVTPSVTTATKPNLKTHTVVMTTAMTGGSTMLLEVVDPTAPPKRGRPKGSRNSYNSPASKPAPVPNPALFPNYPNLAPRPPAESQADTSTLKPPGRPPRPVLRLKIPPPHGFATSHMTKGSQSAGVSPGSSADLPTTPITSFAKLKLKGKILMKRSMSVERMLLQDRSGSAGSMGSLGSAVSSLPPLSSVQTAPVRLKCLPNLRRCESLDESVPLAKRARLQLQEQSDGGRLDSLLYKMLMKGLISSTPTTSAAHFMTSAISMATKPPLPAIASTSAGEAPDVIVIDDGPTDDDPNPSGSGGATSGTFSYPPANVGMAIAPRSTSANVAPFARGISADVTLHFPSVESLPDNLVSGISGLLLRVVTGSTHDRGSKFTSSVTRAVTHDTVVETSEKKLDCKKSLLIDSMPKMQEALTHCTSLKRVGLVEKAAAIQLLLSHSYPILCNRAHVTFCTVLKPQPTYIRQSTSAVSMYSNWKTPPSTSDASDDDLTSRMMLSLYETRRHTDTPAYTNSCRPVSILTHSSYWNGVSPPPPAPPIVTARRDATTSSDSKPASSKSPNQPDLISVALNEVEVSCENTASETAPSGSRIIRLLHGSVAPPVDVPKRVVIFSGGYKTSEEYVYIRGRGRGHYVCELCGIRCKKPSMLKKHIRTHTDLRPYHCYYCSFSFKTKGNLTKHMKSKSHHRKCLELGIFPIPTVVDDTHIDSSALDQQNQVAEESRIHSASTEDTNESHTTDDNDGDDDDNGDDDDEDDDTESEAEMVIDDDAESVHSRSDIQYVAMVSEGSTEATFLKMKSGVRTELNREHAAGASTKFTCQVKGQLPRASIDKEIAASLLDLSKGTDDACKMTTTSAESGLQSVHSTTGHTGMAGLVTTATRVSLSSSKVATTHKVSVISTQCDTPPVDGSTEDTPSSLDEITDRISPASRTWLDNMKAFSERAQTHHTVAEHDYNIGARFIPPLPLGGTPAKTCAESTNIASVHRPIVSSILGGPIIGHFIKQDVSLASILSITLTDTVSSAMALPATVTQSSAVTSSPTACVTIGVSSVGQTTDASVSNSRTPVSPVKHTQPDTVEKTTESVVVTSVSIATVATVTTATTTTVSVATVTTTITQPTQTIPFHLLGLHGLPAVVPSEIPLGVLLVSTASVTPSTSSTATVVQFVTGDNRAPYEIIPIPGRVNDNSASLVDGKYVCHVCGKTFPKQHQLTLHKNIHYFERPFKCNDCSLSFRTKGHLEKHHKSEGHQLKVKVAERSQAAQVATTTGGGGSVENPRPFRCDDCNVAFRIHGHLAKHLRSKLHIMMLEKLGKVPPGAYALIEKNGSFKDVVATDCETSLQCIRRLLTNLDGSTSLGVCDDDSPINIPDEIDQSTVTNVGQAEGTSESAADGFTYHRAGEFEKVTKASNDRVTVERKAELIDFGGFVPETVSSLTGEGSVGRGKDGGGSGKDTRTTAVVDHQCSLCSSHFPDISSLKRHLVTHTELRPHVCEYCDAGFTTAQSLTFHLRTHTQERPYLCGRCGDTFARLSQLQQHSLLHTSQSLDVATSQSPGGATSKSVDGATAQSIGGAISQSVDESRSQSLGGATKQSLDGAISQPLGGATQTSVISTVSHSVCRKTAVCDSGVQQVLPSCGGDENRATGRHEGDGDKDGQRDVSGAGCIVQGDVPVTKSCVEIVSSAITNSTDAHVCPASIAMVTTAGDVVTPAKVISPAVPSENRVSKTPSWNPPAAKRRCLQRQCATAGEDVTMTSSSDGTSSVTTAAIVATPVDGIGQYPSTQHS